MIRRVGRCVPAGVAKLWYRAVRRLAHRVDRPHRCGPLRRPASVAPRIRRSVKSVRWPVIKSLRKSGPLPQTFRAQGGLDDDGVGTTVQRQTTKEATLGVEENKAIVRRFLDEVVGRGDIDVVSELCTTDAMNHAAAPDRQHGIENIRAVMAFTRRAQPDQRWVEQHMRLVGSGLETERISVTAPAPDPTMLVGSAGSSLGRGW